MPINVLKLLSLLFLLVSVSAQLRPGAIKSVSVVEASTGEILAELTTDLNALPLWQSGLDVLVDLEQNRATGSVVFEVDGVVKSIDNRQPFFLSGDHTDIYRAVPELAVEGNHEISITPFQGQNGTGIAGSTLRIPISVSAQQADFQSTLTQRSLATAATDVEGHRANWKGFLSGTREKWHKLTLGFYGPLTSETDAYNPFLNFFVEVVFTHLKSGVKRRVPGFYAADGNAANSGATAGRVWLVHFSPDRTGDWCWNATFLRGARAAIDSTQGVPADFFHGMNGNFTVTDSTETGRDLRGLGGLEYVGEHHLKFKDGPWFLKVGADSPENFLAYDDIDGTPNYGLRRKSWQPHVIDFRDNVDPTWCGGKGRGIIGAVNYLSSVGANAFSFLTMNIGGDDLNVFPFISDAAGDDRVRYDVSKLAQWEVIFEHADHMGMYLHFKTQETENDQLLDGGKLGVERKLYYRELVSRFAHHLALNWNIGEENSNTQRERRLFSKYFKTIDPYQHLVVMHTFPNNKAADYTDLLGRSYFDGASLQSTPANVHSDTLQWRSKSEAAGHSWVVANDEQNPSKSGVLPDSVDPSHDAIRVLALWGNIMAGGGGVEYYFGYDYTDSDLTCQNFRTREIMWQQSAFALDFFYSNSIPFWSMIPVDSRVSDGNWMMVASNEQTAVVYIKSGLGTAKVDLGPGNLYNIWWFDPRQGGELKRGSLSTVSGGTAQNIGSPPYDINKDWAALITGSPIRRLKGSLPKPEASVRESQ